MKFFWLPRMFMALFLTLAVQGSLQAMQPAPRNEAEQALAHVLKNDIVLSRTFGGVPESEIHPQRSKGNPHVPDRGQLRHQGQSRGRCGLSRLPCPCDRDDRHAFALDCPPAGVEVGVLQRGSDGATPDVIVRYFAHPRGNRNCRSHPWHAADIARVASRQHATASDASRGDVLQFQ